VREVGIVVNDSSAITTFKEYMSILSKGGYSDQVTEFERHLLQTIRTLLHKQFTNRSTTSERDLLDRWVPAEGFSDGRGGRVRGGDDIDHTRSEACTSSENGKGIGSEGRLGGWFENEGTSCS
jgi:hypothetical protein